MKKLFENKRFLIVEDDAFNVKLLEMMLEQQTDACEVVVTDKGSEALAILKNNDPAIDVLLLDLNLPEMSGKEILQEVRSMPQCKELPVFIITVDGLDEAQYRDMGATDFILKPFHPDELAKKLAHYFESK